MKYALIKNGEVKNLIEADPDFVEKIHKDWDLIVLAEDKPVDIGMAHDGKDFVIPVIVPPPAVEDPRIKKKADLLQKINSLVLSPQKEILLGMMDLL